MLHLRNVVVLVDAILWICLLKLRTVSVLALRLVYWLVCIMLI